MIFSSNSSYSFEKIPISNSVSLWSLHSVLW